mmetsp:Transcript_12742/g.25803  ORF Transcript_12742/g.25803 Transcript_12742/m.25803 type:complete len:98 (+) Transcript_12742:87-380(+)
MSLVAAHGFFAVLTVLIAAAACEICRPDSTRNNDDDTTGNTPNHGILRGLSFVSHESSHSFYLCSLHLLVLVYDYLGCAHSCTYYCKDTGLAGDSPA